MIWQTARGTVDLRAWGLVMGILNVTPDSFSDGGRYEDTHRAISRAVEMCAQGAGMIDVGGESTRPGASPVPAEEELGRVLPVIRGLLAEVPSALISVDTSKTEVARAALDAGAAVINDVTALRGDPCMAEVVALYGAGLVLMHMQGTPATMQVDPRYDDVVAEVNAFLEERVACALAAGIAPECIAVDPGIGFGKTTEHNLTLLRHFDALGKGVRPVVAGVSRKAFLGKVAHLPVPSERLWPTVGLTALLRTRGAKIFRVHDVRENAAALKAVEAVLGTAG